MDATFDVKDQAFEDQQPPRTGTNAASRGVHAGTTSSVLSDSTRATLTRWANTIKQQGFENVQLYGYADTTGSSTTKSTLGTKRAQAVRDFTRAMTGTTVTYTTSFKALSATTSPTARSVNGFMR